MNAHPRKWLVIVLLVPAVAALIGRAAARSLRPQSDGGPATAPAASPAHDGHEHDHHSHDHDDDKARDHGQEGHDDHDNHAREIRLTKQAVERYGVRVDVARKVTLDDALIAPGRVEFNADAMAHVGSAVTGRVAELKVGVGDAVSKGAVLMIVDSAELGEAQSDFLVKRAAVESAKPAVNVARDAYDRAKQLLEQSQGISLAEVRKREVDLVAAEAAQRAADAAATAAENKLHLYGMSQSDVAELARSGEIAPQYRVVAPIGGQVIEREVTLGELVRPDREALLIIADLSVLWITAHVPEARVADVRPGMTATLSTAALGGQTVEGKVTHVAAAVDAQTRSAKARVEVRDETRTLRPGMFVQVTLVSENTSGAVLAIPEAAVQSIEGKPSVFVPVEGEPSTFVSRPVTIGPPVAGMVAVTSGLNDGDRLVVSGSFILKAELGKSGAGHDH